jgi:NAD(P)-dependent dehydrogenase (short-subunit alcohol dehydrogenase family)
MGNMTPEVTRPSQTPGPDSFSLAGKVAIITGAGKEPGLGAGIGETLARNGASVVINYLSDSTKPRAEQLASRLTESYGGKAVAVQADIESQDGADTLVAEALEAFGATNVHILGK